MFQRCYVLCFFFCVLFLSGCTSSSNNLSTLNLKIVEIENDPNHFISNALAEKLLARGAKSDANGTTLRGVAVFQEQDQNKGVPLISLEFSVKSDDGNWVAHSYVTNRTNGGVALKNRTKATLVDLATQEIAHDFSDIAASRTKKE